MRESARTSRANRRRAAVLLAGLVGTVVVAFAPPASATALAEDFEGPSAQTTYDPVGVSRDCTTAQQGSCSLKLDPPCCSQFANATTTVEASLLTEPRDVTFWIHAESLTGDLDSDVVLTLDVGQVVLHPTGGNNNSLVVSTDQPNSYRDGGTWSPAGQWHKLNLRLDAGSDTVVVSFGDVVRATTAIHPDAGRLKTIRFSGVRWSTVGTPVRYDNLTVSGTAAPPPPPPPAIGDDYEAVYPRTTYNGATRDCTTAQAGSCSLNLDPPCCSAGISAETATDVALPARVSFWITSDSLGGNVDSDVILDLDTGPIRLHPTDGANNALSLFAKTNAIAFASWSPAGQWHHVVIQLDPTTDKATATLNGGVSATVDIDENAAKLDSVSLNGIRWGTGSSIRYDTLVVEPYDPPNQPPTVTLLEPGPDAVLPYLTYNRQHELRIVAGDPERHQWSARVVVKRTRTGEVIHDLATPTLTHGTPYPQWVGKLEPGEYTWSAVATDVNGAVGQTVQQRFTVAPLAFADGVYAALGDSYTSGEGAPDENAFGIDIYENGTDDGEDVNECHRSVKSYPRLVSTDPGMPSQPMAFRACSGAETRNLWVERRYNEDPQMPYVDDETTLVTMSIGGNDSGFGTVLAGCIRQVLNCVQDYDDLVARRFARLNADLGTTASASDLAVDPDIRNVQPLSEVYRRLREAAPRARVMIVGYPRFFRPGGVPEMCSGILNEEQVWMNDKVRQINDIIETRAKERGFEYVDVENALAGHELCSSAEDWMNGISTGGDFMRESFHPTTKGHEAEAAVLRAAIANPPTERASVCPGCVSTTFKTVPAGQRKMTAAIRWPGGDVALALRSPSGRRITRQTTAPDVRRQTGSLFEVVTVDSPEAGSWGIELTGTDVRVGDAADLSLTWQQSINTPPVASFGMTYDNVVTVSVDGRASSDSDGTVVEFLWDWGDGITTSGTAVATHRYVPGTYTITLQARDDAGGTTERTQTITVHGYTWSGFYSPIKAPVARNSATAGKSVKLKWRITLHNGTPVSDPSSFVRALSTRVNCDGTPSTPSYAVSPDAAPTYLGDGTWQYTWNTDAAWKGTCRRFEIELADRVTGVVGGRYALFDFR